MSRVESSIRSRVVALHEALAARVREDPALAADGLGHEQPADARRPDHPGRVELDELHVDELGARLVGERVPVAGALPRVRGDLVAAARAAGRQHERARAEEHELPGRAPVAERARDAVAVLQQVRDRALHEDVDVLRGAAVLQRPDQLQARCGRRCARAGGACGRRTRAATCGPRACGRRCRPSCSSSRTRSGASFACSSAMRQLFRYLPPDIVSWKCVVQLVGRVDVAERRGDSALGHHGVRLAEQRLADERRAGAERRRLDRGAHARRRRRR